MFMRFSNGSVTDVCLHTERNTHTIAHGCEGPGDDCTTGGLTRCRARNVLDEVERRHAVAHGTKQRVAIGRKERVALRVHRAQQVRELGSRNECDEWPMPPRVYVGGERTSKENRILGALFFESCTPAPHTRRKTGLGGTHRVEREWSQRRAAPQLCGLI